MSKKKRIIIFSTAMFLGVLGFVCILLAGIFQDVIERRYINIIGFSSFAFWGTAIFLLLKNFVNLISSEMDEMEETMSGEESFFSMISMGEKPETLKERLIKSGFRTQEDFLYRKQFSLSKDYINFYAVIVEDENIAEYFEFFLKKAECLFQKKSLKRKSNVAYLFFFNRNITCAELDFLKEVIINQDIMHGLPVNIAAILPIVYETENRKYIIRAVKRKDRFSVNLFQIALRRLYMILLQ